MTNLEFEKWWAAYEADLGPFAGAGLMGPERQRLKALARAILGHIEGLRGQLGELCQGLAHQDESLARIERSLQIVPPVIPTDGGPGPGPHIVDPGHRFEGPLPPRAFPLLDFSPEKGGAHD